MRTDGFRRGLIPISLIFALVLSTAFIPTSVRAAALIFYPVDTIDVIQGQTFLLRHRMAWDEPGVPGYYLIAIYWDYTDQLGNPDNAWHFTLVSATAYFDNDGDGLPDPGVALIDNYVSTGDNGSRYTICVSNAAGNDNLGIFNVDITLRAAGPDGTLHAVTDNHSIKYTYIQMLEGVHPLTYIPTSVIVRVLPVVEVDISTSYQEGPPGDVLEYATIVTNRGETTDRYDLAVNDNAGWNPTLSENLLENLEPGENRVVTLSVTIPENASSGTEDGITVTATSREKLGVWDNDVCIAKALIVRVVEVSISPENQSGPPRETFTYTVTVMNMGNVEDNYDLTVSDDAAWEATLSDNLVDNRLENVQPGENRIITLSVTVPENTTSFDEDSITVTATSQGNAEVSDAEVCVAEVWGKADFKLENLYAISLDTDLWLGEGSKLVVRFYTYADSYQGENIVWSGTTPDNVSFSKTVPHPLGGAVQKARLDLTTDDTENAISTIASFTVTTDTLVGRLLEIYMEWPFLEGKWALRDIRNGELVGIYTQWPYAPWW